MALRRGIRIVTGHSGPLQTGILKNGAAGRRLPDTKKERLSPLLFCFGRESLADRLRQGEEVAPGIEAEGLEQLRPGAAAARN